MINLGALLARGFFTISGFGASGVGSFLSFAFALGLGIASSLSFGSSFDSTSGSAFGFAFLFGYAFTGLSNVSTDPSPVAVVEISELTVEISGCITSTGSGFEITTLDFRFGLGFTCGVSSVAPVSVSVGVFSGAGGVTSTGFLVLVLFGFSIITGVSTIFGSSGTSCCSLSVSTTSS